MKITILFKSVLFIAAIFMNGVASAYSPEETEVECKKPRFTDFSLTTYNATENIEVAPESEFYFKVSPWVDPTTITLSAKQQALNFGVESNNSFHKVKAKLPAALAGQFVRISTSAKAVSGCDNQTGWLVKIAKQ
ncbi:MAG: hypothetical protein Q7U57_11305 [Methylovulum sp.]|nr:hypothetical protein [Methylovulum sp.]